MAKNPTKIPTSKIALAMEAGSTTAAMKDAGATNGKLYLVPIDKIKPIPDFNVRVDNDAYRAHRDMIATSMVANGYDESKPLAGYVAKEADGNVIYVTDGHTRLDAARQVNADDSNDASFDKLPVVVRSTPPSMMDLTVALHTANSGRPLSPFELGVVVKRLLKEDGADKNDIANRLAVTPRYLDDVLLLVNSPKEVRTAVLDGNVSSTMAIQELRKAGDKPEKAAERITAAVAKAKASGKKKATAKDVGPKMQKVRSTVSVAEGTDMKEIVKAVAAQVRAAIVAKADGDDEDAIKLAAVDGTISIVVEVPAPDKPKTAAKKTTAKPKDAPSPTKDTTQTKKAAPAKKAAAAKKTDAKPKATAKADAKTPPAPEGDDDDLKVEGAEEVTSDDQDTELAQPPIAVPNGEGADKADDI